MPSKEKKRDLYIAGSMAELQKKSEIKPQTTNARILAKSADTMFREAEKFDLQGDEERAFIMYMRYFNIIEQVKTNADYKKNKQYYDNLLGQKNPVRAIERAEQLSESLKERYELREAEAVAKKFAALEASGQRKEKETEVVEDKTPDNKKNGSMVDELGAKDQPSTSADSEVRQPIIVPTSLCSLLRDSSTQLIVMDARMAADFAESHINHPACISVPQEVLTPGTTVTSIENQLAPNSVTLWKQRGNVDHIILLDWSSKLDAVTICTPLRTLKDALFKYDSTVIIKSEPLVLEGGYEQWLLFYPTMTTNSRVSRPAVSVNSSVSLLDFDYPDFEESPKPSESQDSSDSMKDQKMADIGDASPKVVSGGTVPQFNRALKPKSSGQSIAESFSKTSELNNARNVNLATRDSPSGEGVTVLTNNLYPSVVLAPSKKTEKNTNVVADQGRGVEDNRKKDNIPPPQPPPSAAAPAAERQEEAEERARLKALEEKRKREEKALADIMRKKRHVEQDLKEMQLLAMEERQAKEAHAKAVQEEDAERKRQAEVEKLRLERKKKELESQREKDRQENLAKEQELLEARDRMRREEEEKTAAQQHAEKLHQAKLEADRLRQAREEQARQEAEKQAQLKRESELRAAAIAAQKEEEKRKEEEEEERRRKEEERMKKEEERKKREEKEKEEAEEAERRKRKAEEKVSQEGRKDEVGEADGGIRHAQEPKMIPSPSLPAGWEKRLDNATHRYYYIDHNRGKTQWEPPASTSVPPRKDTYTTRLKEEPAAGSSRGGLSRSHSSPDIMKQLADEAKASSKPVYDRTSKPFARMAEGNTTRTPVMRQSARRRDLNPVYGNVGPAMTGLRNLGNTCYMNSTVQCLSNTTPLVTYLVNDTFLNDINRDSSQGMHGEVVDEFAVVVKALWSGQYRCITPRDLKNTVGQYNPMFAGYQQQDSQEFLTFLLDGLHEGLNEVKVRPQIPDQDNDRIPDGKAAALAWENHKRLHRSIIVELFQGQLKSTLMCRSCHKKSVTFQAFMYISLPIPASNKCTLKDCFKAFLQPEMMTGSCKWKCPQCKVERDAEKKIDIWKLPHILLIGLNRFVSDGMWMQKKTTYVDFPVNDLDLEEFTLGARSRSRYNLYGVSNHYGTMEGGHYTAFCRNPCNSKWHKFDDHEVYEMSKSDVKTSAAFVLYYTAIPLNAPHFKPQL